ncbi:MAG: hypothetical protein IT567_01495 [Alphaproteobacteria bacterium]|nr:hypothetical protein [Alphaproteobacteria bacterium]
MPGLPNGNVWEEDLMPYDWKLSSDGYITNGFVRPAEMNEPVTVTMLGNVPAALFDVDEGTSLHLKGHWWFWYGVDAENGGSPRDHYYYVVEEVTIND